MKYLYHALGLAPYWPGYACHECHTYAATDACRGWGSAYAVGPAPTFTLLAVMLCPECWRLANAATSPAPAIDTGSQPELLP